jgi:polysaccharide export outer membrane protein
MRTECERSRNTAWLAVFAPILFFMCAALVRADTAPGTAPGTAPSATTTGAPPPQDYRIGAGDLLKIQVFGSPELSTDARVAQSGTITCPLIGLVNVAGLSSSEVERTLAQKFIDGSFLKQPQVSVLIVEYVSQKVSVLGHVSKPGQYALRASSNVMDVLAEAGGVIAQTASDYATLMRGDGTKVDLNLDALFRGDPTQNVAVAGGDRLYIPRAENFYIYGQVQKPGQYRLERNMTLSRAVSAAGGLTSRGTERRATVKRRDAKGKEDEYSLRESDVLKADDVIVIKESWF